MFTFHPPETVLGWVFLYEKKLKMFSKGYSVFILIIVHKYRKDNSLLYNTNDDNRIYHICNIHGTSHIEVIFGAKIFEP